MNSNKEKNDKIMITSCMYPLAHRRGIYFLFILALPSFNFLARHKFSYGQYQPYFRNDIVLLILLGNTHIDIEQGVTILIITGYHQISFALYQCNF